jgi:phosphoserine/homoserine phosphotransferase
MKIVCLDLEGVLVPEIWIAFAEAVGIDAFRRTTRDEPDYDALMRYRLKLLDEHHLKLPDIEAAIRTIEPLPRALDFCGNLRAKTQLIILSDTFEQFARPLMEKLAWPTLFCNTLTVADDGRITGYHLRQNNGKLHAVEALKSINMQVFAAGDSFNDLAMIQAADSGCLFRAPETIRREYSSIPCGDSYDDLMQKIDAFLL